MTQNTQISINRHELALLAADAAGSARISGLPDSALDGLAVYLELLLRWNAAFNLVGFHSWQEIFTRLVADSFYLADFLTRLFPPGEPLLWDLGAGAGLPGIPLRLIRPQGEYHMVERREKRALFLSTALARLGLKGTHVFRGEAGHFFASRRPPEDKPDGIVSRAFLPWPALLELARPHLHPGGRLIIFASKEAPAELPPAWKGVDFHAYAVAGDKRHLWALAPSGD
ncbi:MAG: class I SAM-dependent methyltransferase [Desulfovibrio sp.]|jgi:16S rRNA (guanine527-N7)-methyltransferase|nr:class I SAM-dependent methyltransferase [Desulfovibrio sp.]